jgi:hypothetical protein
VRLHVRDQQLLFLVELDPLHRGLLDPEQPCPYASRTHAVLPPYDSNALDKQEP